MTDFLECRGIHKSFGGLTALAAIRLHVQKGEILGIIGPNGAGKTTLFNIISGTDRPTKGTVLFKGMNISQLPPNKICRLGISRTYQLVRTFSSLTSLQNVLLGICFGRKFPPPRELRIEKAMEILNFLGLGPKADHPAESLTLVEKKHLEIARALGTDPEVLLLDEVVSGLAPGETSDLINTIREIQRRGVTIVLIEHVLRVVTELCQRVVVLNYGAQIADGAPLDVVNDPRVVEAYLGEEHAVARPDA